MATNAEGPIVQGLVDPDSTGYPGVKWDNINPWWAVIMDADRIIGCCQLIMSQPIAHIENLHLQADLSPTQKSYAIKVLEKYCIMQLFSHGIYVAQSCIPNEMKQWKKIVKKHYGTHLYNGSMYAMRIH